MTKTSLWEAFWRCTIVEVQHLMSFRTSHLCRNNLLTMDGSIRVFDNALLEFRAEVVNGIRRPAVHVRRAIVDQRIGEGTFATPKAWSTFVDAPSKSILKEGYSISKNRQHTASFIHKLTTRMSLR
jgi:hypothetical protein